MPKLKQKRKSNNKSTRELLDEIQTEIWLLKTQVWGLREDLGLSNGIPPSRPENDGGSAQ